MSSNDEMRDSYDFSGGVRGKHHKAYQRGTNIVKINPNLMKIFPTEKAINEALEKLAEQMKKAS